MHDKIGIYYLTSTSAGASSAFLLGVPLSETERAIAFAFIVAFALFFGSLARLATFTDNNKTERRKVVMTFGALYVISLFMANWLQVDIMGAALIAVGVGSAGPLVLIPLVDGVTRASKAFFNKDE